nr:hypothetical protein [Tanacetum cinerariifolium]
RISSTNFNLARIRDLVRQESPRKPGMRSRLWDHEESFNVLKLRKGTGDIIGLCLDMRMLKNQTLRGSFELQTDTLSNLDNLKLLQLNYVHINGSYENFPEELKWLCMHGLQPRQKRLNGSCSKDKRSLGSLKILDLSFCEQLWRLSGFSELPALERLIVTNCIRLVQVCESVEQCAELSLIDLSYCYNLEKLPTSLGKLKVKTLLLDGCGLHERPAEMRGMDSQEMVRATNSQEFSCAIPNPEMSTLKLEAVFELYNPWSIETEGMFKTQSMSGAVNILCSLGWNNSYDTSVRRRGRQIYYEFGIFSTLYLVGGVVCGGWGWWGRGEAMPNWIRDRNKGPTISFTIPLSPKNLRGLNFCNVQQYSEFFKVPSITISNVTKNITWIYNHLILGAQIENKFIIFLSHWMFGANEMEAGDQVTITETQRTQHDNQLTEECGISLMCDDDDDGDDDNDDDSDDDDDGDDDDDDDGRMKEEDVLSYYKSWKHIIGKDLSAFQSAIREYILQNKHFSWDYVSYYNKIVYKVPDAKNSIG